MPEVTDRTPGSSRNFAPTKAASAGHSKVPMVLVHHRGRAQACGERGHSVESPHVQMTLCPAQGGLSPATY